MADKDSVAELQPQFSSPGATLTPWAEARGRLEKAEVYWLATVRPDGRPHITPLLSVRLDGALYFCTSNRDGRGNPTERDDRILRIVPG